MKRDFSPELVARSSAFNASVTLYEPTDRPSSSDSPMRRSKRLKTAAKPEYAEDDDEDIHFTPKKRKTKSKVLSSPKVKVEEAISSSSSPVKAQRTPSPRKPKPIPQSLDIPHPAPDNWHEVYDKIVDMRSQIVAPVDTMGCGRAQLEETEPKNQRFATLVSLMLSSQTKDEVTSAAVTKLRNALGGSLNVEAVIAADDKTISDAICKVGFWRRKTEYIKKAAQRLYDEFDCDVPKTVDELCSLPGVGPKMAFLALHVAWKVNAGIGVDVHVHRITNRLGWHKPPSKTPEETRLNLQSWLPTELRPTFTGLLVGFGQVICLPVGPRCDSCQLSNGLCPSARIVAKGKGKKAAPASSSSARPKIEIKLEDEELEHAIEPADLAKGLSDNLPRIKPE